jgi:hypothetical protein
MTQIPTSKQHTDAPNGKLVGPAVPSMIDMDQTLSQLSDAGAMLEESLDASEQFLRELAIGASSPGIGADPNSKHAIADAANLVGLDPMDPKFIDRWLVEASRVFESGLGLVLVNTAGKILESYFKGFDSVPLRLQSGMITKIAKRAMLDPRVLVSVSSLAEDDSEDDPSSPTAKGNSFCVNLNRLSQITERPLLAFAWRLKQSSGYALLIIDASIRADQKMEICKVDEQQPTDSRLIQLEKSLDSWYLIKRCKWAIRWFQRADWLKTHPRAIGIPIVCAILSLLCPIPYYPKRECIFEPEFKQFVPSPVAGRIAKCQVRPGDRVENGQLLANLDGEEMKRELATAEAELEGAQKKFNAALASKSSGDRGIAKVEIQKAEAKIQSLRDQLQRLEVRATTDGVIVQGDWQKSIGMPVTLGQNLFEIAKLESMTAEVHLSAQDLGQIKVGDRVAIRTDVAGGHTFVGEIGRIEPRAKIEDTKAIFVADVVISDPHFELRPGMKASAQITAGWRSLGWLLFSRPYRWFLNQWVW